MEIHHFPQVQILGNHAKIREGKHYIELGVYNGDGSFEWSPEGIARRDALLAPVIVGEVDELEVEDPLEAELAEARERNAARNKKQNRRVR